jgi:CBS domain-containing protein
VVDARGRLEGVLSIDDLARRAVEARGAARGRVTERDVARTLSRIVGPTRVIDVPAEAARVRPRR